MGKDKGFTLIELLVVVAIIGFLASLVLLNTQSTRLQAHDAQIQTLMHQLRNAADLSYNQGVETYATVCDEGDNTLSDSGDFGRLEAAIKKENGNSNVTCFEGADKTQFAASSRLRAESGKSWCVESAGLSAELNCLAINSFRCQCP